MIRQFPLRLAQTRAPTFSNFIVTGRSGEIVAALLDAVENDAAAYLYLWGNDCGKSHLLMAACDTAEKRGLNAVYLPLREISGFSPNALDALEQYQLIALDDIDAISGNDDWEEALFHLYNRIRERDGKLLVSASSSPATLDIRLPDLASRLMWGAAYKLETLDDTGFAELLTQIGEEKGMTISDEIANYLINRYSRSAGGLVELMERLDAFSLEQKKKITIPLLRQLLSLEEPSSATTVSPP